MLLSNFIDLFLDSAPWLLLGLVVGGQRWGVVSLAVGGLAHTSGGGVRGVGGVAAVARRSPSRLRQLRGEREGG